LTVDNPFLRRSISPALPPADLTCIPPADALPAVGLNALEGADDDGAPSTRSVEAVGEDIPLAMEVGPEVDLATRQGRLQEIASDVGCLLGKLERVKHAASKVARVGFEAKLRLGIRLMEARALCRRGKWRPYVESLGMKTRHADEAIQFARNRELFEGGNAHGAHWTTGKARKAMADPQRGLEQTRPGNPATGQDASSSGRRRGDNLNDQRRPDQPDDETTVATGREPVAVSTDAPDAETNDPPAAAAQPGAAPDPEDADVVVLIATPTPTPATDPIGPDVEEGQPAGPTSPEPSDDEWLAAIPLRRALADTSQFDRDALLWRRMRQLAAQVAELINPTAEEIGRSNYFNMVRNRYRLRLLFGLRINNPSLWRICSKCRGKYTNRPGTMPCGLCDGFGYSLSHEAEVVEEEDVLE
jgi:hypothetical protein